MLNFAQNYQFNVTELPKTEGLNECENIYLLKIINSLLQNYYDRRFE